LRWPEPIPPPGQVTFRWGRVATRRLGTCAEKARVITINRLYRDERLRSELDHVMAHEASHFIWRGHPKAFKDFLRRAGVAEPYRRAQAPLSETFEAVKADWLERYSSVPGSLRPRLPVTQIVFPFDD
jgi:predicted metal-dependent hydrolase